MCGYFENDLCNDLDASTDARGVMCVKEVHEYLIGLGKRKKARDRRHLLQRPAEPVP